MIDTHVHLNQLENIEGALKEAAAQGLKGIVAVGVDLAANKKNLEIKQATLHPKIFLAFGIHPGNIQSEEVDECLQQDFVKNWSKWRFYLA